MNTTSEKVLRAMASLTRPWIALCFLSVATSDHGFLSGWADARGFLSQAPNIAEEPYRPNVRLDMMVGRWKREVLETRRERCVELAAPWTEAAAPPQGAAQLLRLRFRPLPPEGARRIVFPGKSLFNFVRRIYHCCQGGLPCRNVRGIQGHSSEGADVEFLLTRDVLSVAPLRAELHLQLFNPQHLSIQPGLPSMAKRGLPTRYNMWSQGDTVELRVDLLSLFRGLWETAGGARGGSSLVNMRRAVVLSGGGPGRMPAPLSLQDTDGDLWGDGRSNGLRAVELALALSCSMGGWAAPCEQHGLRLLHTPFIALSYR